jgi:hypothetical protein
MLQANVSFVWCCLLPVQPRQKLGLDDFFELGVFRRGPFAAAVGVAAAALGDLGAQFS